MALILILALGILPLGPMMLTFLETRYPTPETLPHKIDGVILLGGSFESYLSKKTNQIVANDQVDRAFCFLEIAKAHPESRLVFSGGSGDIMNPETLESEDAKAFFALMGLGNREIVYESESRNTYENAVFSKKIMDPKSGEKWVLVTSAYHMPRSVGVFEKAGWPVIPYQCDRKTDGTYSLFSRTLMISGNYSMLNMAVKELIGSTVYYLTGKTAFILPPAPVP